MNRVDEIITFHPLTRGQIKEIVGLQLAQLNERLSQAEVKLSVTPDALGYLAERGYDPQFGARPVKRVIQREVLNSLSKALLSGDIDKQHTVVLDVFDGEIVFRKPIEAEGLVAVS